MSTMRKIFLGSDHGGFALKAHLVEMLRAAGEEVHDMGVLSETAVDYPDIAQKTCGALLQEPEALGILICGTGIGISIAANKLPGIRAALCTEEYSARMARAHNNANVLCLGGRVTGPELAFAIVRSFLSTQFEGGRHQRRVDKIEPHP